MRLADGREQLLTFGLPLDLTVVSELLLAVGEAAQRLGYTDIQVGDDNWRGVVTAVPPPRPVVLPH